MENQKNDNLNLLEAVVQNTEMGKNRWMYINKLFAKMFCWRWIIFALVSYGYRHSCCWMKLNYHRVAFVFCYFPC